MRLERPEWDFFRDPSSGSPETPVLPLPTFRSRRDLESEISAARPVIAARTPRVRRLVGAGTEPEDEDEADWEPDVVPRVDGARRRHEHGTTSTNLTAIYASNSHPSIRKRPQNVVSMKRWKRAWTLTNGARVRPTGA